MTNSDYILLIHICQYSLRKGSDLNMSQIADIDRMIQTLYIEQQKVENSTNAVVKRKKLGKIKRV